MSRPKLLGWTSSSQREMSMSDCLNKEAEFDLVHKNIILQEIIRHGYIICGDSHQVLAMPVFSDGYIMVSMRTWAELMEEAYKVIRPMETSSDYGNFYMACSCLVDEKLPPSYWSDGK